MRRLVMLCCACLLMLAPAAPAAAQADGEEIDGGPAAPEATEAEAGTTYVDDVRPGEARWYAVEAGVGQQVRATLTEYGEVEYGCCLELKLHDPDYEQLAFENGNNSDGTAASYSLESDEVEDAGTYYLEISLDEDAAVRPVTYEFDLAPTGEAVPSEGETSESPSPEASASPTTGEDDTQAATGSSDDSGVPGGLWVVLGLLVLLVLLLLVVVVLMMVRQHRQPAGPRGSGQQGGNTSGPPPPPSY